MKTLFVFLTLLILPWSAWSATVQCDGSVADCQAKINAAADGDIITFPSGMHTYDWSSAISIPDKRITIQGRGAGVTIINDLSGATAVILINGPTKMPRITGLSFVGDQVGVYGYAGITARISSNTPAKGLRIDHNSFTYNGGSHVFIIDNAYGVIDNNTFTSSSEYVVLAVLENNKGDFPGGVGFNGNVSWNRRAELGTDNAVYFEDNVVNFADCASQAVDGDMGSRMVVRYNKFINTQLGMHGPGQSPSRGALQDEFYGNLIEYTSNCPVYHPEALYFNSGTGMAFNNKTTTASEFETYFRVAHYRDNYIVAPNMDPPFNERCDGLTHMPRIDGNTPGMNGYPCADQPGTDGALLLTNTGQAHAPLYFWGNRSENNILLFVGPKTNGNGYIEHVLKNRDYYDHESSFTGTVGVGVGIPANKPATCKAGVGYWATNQSTTDLSGQVGTHPSTPISGTLYKATAANTWTAYYTPYTYPHPLRGENTQQTLLLSSGWNWISFNVLPADLSLNTVFNGILDKIEQVKSQTQSAIRISGNWKGDLANMDGIGQYKMYKVKVNAACALTATGTSVLSATPIQLVGGWNWVAYLPTTAMPIATALDSIKGQVLEVKSLTQHATYSGGAWSGTLTQLEPGQGYAIKMSALGTLIYPTAAAVQINQQRKNQ
jgi:hypothetical protein